MNETNQLIEYTTSAPLHAGDSVYAGRAYGGL